jgi:hypothetical protein
MDESQIAQVKGSLANFLTNNPTQVPEFFANFDNSDIWYFGSGAPTTTHELGSFYFNVDNGDIYVVVENTGNVTWSYVCNYFDSHSSRIISKEISYTDINGGKAPQPVISLPLPNLNANEIISMAWIVLLEKFVSSSVSPSLDIRIDEPTYTGTVVDFGDILLNYKPYVYVMQGFAAVLGSEQVIGIKMVSITVIDRLLNVVFTSDELTNLSAGKVKLFYKIETLS